MSAVGTSALATVAARNALAAADLDPLEIDLIIVGTCTADEIIPNVASKVQQEIGAKKCRRIRLKRRPPRSSFFSMPCTLPHRAFAWVCTKKY